MDNDKVLVMKRYNGICFYEDGTKKKYKDLESLKIKLLSVEQDIQEVAKKIVPLEDKRTKLFTTRRELQAQIDVLTVQSFKKPDWNYILLEDGMVSGKRAEYRSEQLKKIGLDNSCYYRETQQVVVRICLSNGNLKTLKDAKKGLKIILPYIKPIKGYKHIGIMERSLSANGIYNLRVKGNKFCIVKTTYGTDTTLQTYKTLDEALQYIYEHIYYERVDSKGKTIYKNND